MKQYGKIIFKALACEIKMEKALFLRSCVLSLDRDEEIATYNGNWAVVRWMYKAIFRKNNYEGLVGELRFKSDEKD